ncbi:MAG: putative DNA binding domain-containing protein [Spirochaetaceae bacterium]|nr:putative DNA binding domain-containing protein [Spirochaetaceae bacterium]
MQNLELLIKELIKLPNETECVEFKHNNFNPDMIASDISALANSATYKGKNQAYMVWGIHNETHEILGTNYNRFSKLIKNQEIGSWLKNTVSKNADFDFYDAEIDGKKLVILIIQKAIGQPVTSKKEAYIRIGSYTKPLKDYPAMEAQLWDKLRLNNFEKIEAKSDLQKSDIFQYLDFGCYFDLQNIPVPTNQDGILHYILEDDIVRKQDNGLYSITNLGAILFAKRINDFPSVARKAIRVVQYEDDTKLKILKEFNGTKGYAVGFEGLMGFLEALLPSEEVITETVRKTVTKYPMIPLREIIANALIHQDFTIPGSSPLVEIFQSRIEVTNPGIPLVDINRFIDNPPKSRNEALSSLMRRLKMCEELGSGWDRIVIECELKQLPAPKIVLYEENTKIIMFSEMPYAHIPHEEKLWSCYLHACIKYVMGERMTNLSLRSRMHIEEKNKAAISRLISEAIKENLIKPFDKDTAPRYMSYIPIWA